MRSCSNAALDTVMACAIVAALSAAAIASDCTQTNIGEVPIDELGSGLYLEQFQGGLYPNGSNTMPRAHAAAGAARADAVEPLNLQGQPHPQGKYVLLSIGMSNTTQEFCSQSSGLPCDAWTFMGQAAADSSVNHNALRIVIGAAGGQTAATWDSPSDQNYNRVRDTRLIPQGLSEAQVQIVWIKVADAQPQVSLPDASADAYVLMGHMGNIVRAVKVRYPNVKLVFLSSRIYAGYAQGVSTLNPEPYAYESGFAVKWLIEAQIDQMSGGGIDPIAGDLDFNVLDGAPWLAWGPYLWADGLIPRSDGLIWQCADFQADGTHPSMSGEQKVANLLMDFMLNSPFATPWFRDPIPGDINNDTVVDVNDLLGVINNWGPCVNPPPPPENCPADIAPAFGVVNVNDLLVVINNWGS
jgi:hypothetical protein